MPSTDLLVTGLVIGILASVLAILLAMVPVGLLWMRGLGHKLDDLKLALNGKMDQLLHAYGASQRAEGVEQERTEEYARQEAEHHREERSS